jgi:hypothetical protein
VLVGVSRTGSLACHGGAAPDPGRASSAALEITWMGTHNGPLALPSGSLPATGKAVEFDGVQVFIVEGGR